MQVTLRNTRKLGLNRLVWIPVILALILLSTACKERKAVSEYVIPELSVSEGGLVAENSTYLLQWDDEQKCVLLEDKITGTHWSTVPYDYYLQGKSNVNISSPLFLDYYSPEDGSLQNLKAFPDCMEEGNYSVTAIENGIRILFYFIDAEATVPLDFVLREDSVKVSVPLGEIEESGKTEVVSISVLPYFCSTENTAEHSSYLFVPSGSGALMYTDEEIQYVSRSYTGEVYGTDASAVQLDHPAQEEPIRIPVYGVTAGNDSLMAIIESGEASASIRAEAGNFRNGYSTVYAVLNLRGGDRTEAERNGYNDEIIYAEDFDRNETFSIGYYPLSGQASGYNGMAERYRRYLSEQGELKTDSAEQNSYHITLIGGAMTKKYFMGFPYRSLSSATTLKQSLEILEDLIGTMGETPAVTLQGFGSSGIDSGAPAGGFSFDSKLGSQKDVQTLVSFCEKNNIPLFTDFDIVSFSASGSGFSATFDVAKTAGKQLTTSYPLLLGVRTENTSLQKIRLMRRSKLSSAVDKVEKTASRYGFGVSFSTLSSVAYSDYNDEKYFMKGNMRTQVKELLNSLSEKGYPIAGSAANSYAAACSDLISSVPLDSGAYANLDCSVPFYSMVFGGTGALYSQPLNLSEDFGALLLRAVEAGVAPSFTLTSEYERRFSDSAFSGFYGTKYANQKETIRSVLEQSAGYYRAIANQQIREHEIVASGVTKTVFSGGTTVWVNHTDRDVTVEGRSLEAESFWYID